MKSKSCFIDWHAKSNHVLFNPRTPENEKALLGKAALALDSTTSGNFIFATSGSTGVLKWVVLPKEAVLASAKAVNAHLCSDQTDRWLNPLPAFHVGGLGIYARAYLSGASVFCYEDKRSKWHAHSFVNLLEVAQATLTALVPAQVFDLVSACLDAPPSLRAVVVGGGILSSKLYFEAVARGWKLLPSYGLTECASQVATAALGSWRLNSYPKLTVLDHVTLALTPSGQLKIKSKALLCAYLFVEKENAWLLDPKQDGWFVTEDKALMENGMLTGIHREGSFVKIGGESVDMLRLESILEEVKLSLNIVNDAVLFSVPDERLGHVIHLAIAGDHLAESMHSLLQELHSRLFPFERVRKVHALSQIPRSPLRKVLKNELLLATVANSSRSEHIPKTGLIYAEGD